MLSFVDLLVSRWSCYWWLSYYSKSQCKTVKIIFGKNEPILSLVDTKQRFLAWWWSSCPNRGNDFTRSNRYTSWSSWQSWCWSWRYKTHTRALKIVVSQNTVQEQWSWTPWGTNFQSRCWSSKDCGIETVHSITGAIFTLEEMLVLLTTMELLLCRWGPCSWPLWQRSFKKPCWCCP